MTSPSTPDDEPSTPGSPLTDEPLFLMARASSLGSAAANKKLARLALKVRQYSVLALACGDPAPTQTEVSSFLVLDPSQVVGIVDDLEQRGAVERRPGAHDRRSKTVRATADGRRLFAEARSLLSESTADSLAALTAEEQDQLNELLRRIAL